MNLCSRSPIRLSILLTITVVTGAVPDARAQTAEEVMNAVRMRLNGVETLAADFDQTFSSEYLDQTETKTGTILLKGDMYRVETASQTFVTNGRITWIYNRPENQVLINNYVEDETTFSLNRFLFDFDELYYVVEMDSPPTDPGHHRIKLRAMDPAAFFPEVTITVRREDHQITRLEVVDANETVITINLTSVVLDPAIPEDAFSFEPPEGSEIVDLRS